MSILETLPKTREAVLMIAHDNGCINREEPEEKVLSECDLSLLFGVADRPMLERVEASLAALSPEDFQTFVIGDAAEAEDIMSNNSMQEAHVLLDHFYEVITK